MNHVAITGARGYLGNHLSDFFASRGWQVSGLVRTASPQANEIAYSLSDPLPPSLFDGVDTLIHAAHDFSGTTLDTSLKINFEGSKRLFNAAREQGVSRIIYISSMAAFDGCSSIYGKTKRAVEEEASRAGAWIIRPGTIYGGSHKGLFGSLQAMATKLPIIPLLDGGGQPLYLIAIDDLCQSILKMASMQGPVPRTPLTLACTHPLPLRAILAQLAKGAGKKPRFLALPSFLLLIPMQVAEALGITLPFRSDSLVSLCNLNPKPVVQGEFEGIRFGQYEL